MKERPVQHFSAEYLEYCSSLSTEQICRFVEDFRKMIFATGSDVPKDEAASSEAQARTDESDPPPAK